MENLARVSSHNRRVTSESKDHLKVFRQDHWTRILGQGQKNFSPGINTSNTNAKNYLL
jgi:hypothetical protein